MDGNTFFHESPTRANLVTWIPVEQEQSALEVQPKSLAITEALKKKYDSLSACTIADLPSENLGTFSDVYMVDCLAEAGEYYDTEGTNPFIAMLEHAGKLLKPEGRLILAMQNKLGLRYWAGCQEEHNGGFFISVENYPNGEKKKTFSRREYLQLLEQAGFSDVLCYYPYPDIYYPTTIYSDEFLPKQGELQNNITNYDRDRYLFFDESKVYDTLLAEGLFSQFSNGFLFIAKKGTQTR